MKRMPVRRARVFALHEDKAAAWRQAAAGAPLSLQQGCGLTAIASIEAQFGDRTMRSTSVGWM